VEDIRLKQFEDRYRRQFETAPDGIVIIDFKAGTVLAVNPKLINWLGYPRDEIIGRVFWSIGAWGDQAEGQAVLRELQDRGFVQYDEVTLRSKSGVQFETSILGSTYDEDDRKVIQLNIRDSTERIRAQRALRESEERFRLFSDNVTDYAFILMDPEGRIQHWNSGARRIFGYAGHEVIGRNGALIFTAEQREQGEPLDEIQTAVRNGCAEDERWHIRKDGSKFWASGVMQPMRDINQQLRGFAKIVRDITERKMAQEEIARKAEALARSNADLQQFGYVTSHDLQEPLRSITSYAQLLSERYGQQLDENANQFIGYIISGAERMSMLIRDLLMYSRVVNAEDFPTTVVDMNAVADWAIMNLQLAIEDTKAVVIHDDLPPVEGNQMQLIQLLQNLISNSIKYRRQDKPPEIHIGARRSGNDWEFSVRDNGIGIEPQYHERIFGLFKRLHGRDVPGTGIGLALCRKIVEQHGGKLRVESEVGAGSTFHFTLG
jgi:PAS domain S-box-containing protein